jgi:hypothetical protein
MKTKDQKICASCKHWKNKQAELEYHEESGICTSHALKFSIYADSMPPAVLDRGNVSTKFRGIHHFENQSKEVPIGAVEKSRYVFVTGWQFGCVNFEKSKD